MPSDREIIEYLRTGLARRIPAEQLRETLRHSGIDLPFHSEPLRFDLGLRTPAQDIGMLSDPTGRQTLSDPGSYKGPEALERIAGGLTKGAEIIAPIVTGAAP